MIELGLELPFQPGDALVSSSMCDAMNTSSHLIRGIRRRADPISMTGERVSCSRRGGRASARYPAARRIPPSRARRCRRRECEDRRPPPAAGARYPHRRPGLPGAFAGRSCPLSDGGHDRSTMRWAFLLHGARRRSRHDFCLSPPRSRIGRCNLVTEGSMYRPLDQVSHDLRFALRQFRRAPGSRSRPCWRWPAGLAG